MDARRRLRIAVLLGVLAVLLVVAWRTVRHDVKRALRSSTKVADAPPVARTRQRSAGCDGATPNAPNTTYELPDRRRFHLFPPRRLAPGTPATLLLAFHGWGDDGLHLADWMAVHEHVDDATLTVYPDADADWDLGGPKDVAFVTRIVAAIGARHCIDPSRVLAFGFSWGGRFASRVACSPTSPLAAVAIGDASYHDARRGDTCPASDVFVTVRTHDEDERPEWGRDAARRWAESARCKTQEPLASHPGCAAWTGCADGKRVVLCEDAFFDPSWPKAWNHTVRAESLELARMFFAGQLP